MFQTNVKKLIKVLFLLVISSNFLFSQCEDCIESLELLSKRATLLNLSYTQSLTQKDSLLQRITHLNNEITLYKTGLKYPDKGLAPLVDLKNKPVMPKITETNTIITKPKDDIQNKVFLDAIKKSKRDISKLQKSVNAANSTVAAQKKDIDNLQKIINKLNKEISTQNNRNKELESEVTKLELILDCIKKFEAEIKQPSDDVSKQLAITRRDYEEYKRLLRVKSPDIVKREAIIARVINAYEAYKGKEKEMDCGGIRLSVFQDYLTIDDYVNISEIYGKNYGNSVTRLDSTNQINEANRRVLDASGKVMEKGNYDQRSTMVNNLPSFVTEERRPGSANSEVKGNLNRIIIAYNSGRYLESLTTYDKYQKFMTLESLQKEKHLLDEVEYCIGNILLWDLGAYGNNINDIVSGDWISVGNNQQIGFTKLNVLADDKKANLKLRKLAAIAINKYYE